MVSRVGVPTNTGKVPIAGQDPCKRCPKSLPEPRTSVTVTRTEPFCLPCFDRFISTKVRKQLGEDVYKPLYRRDKTVIETTAKILVPVYGARVEAAGMVVRVLTELLEGHRKGHRRVGFYLHVLRIVDDEQELKEDDWVQSWLLDKYGSDIEKYERISINSYFDSPSPKELQTIQVELNSHVNSIPGLQPDLIETPSSFNEILNILPTNTSRSDITTIIINQLISKYAAANGCQSIFEPFTLTYLAERAIGLVCKGRGVELGTSLTPVDLVTKSTKTGPLTEEDIVRIRPIADLYDNEIKSYLALHDLSVPEPHITRLEEQYGSLGKNVNTKSMSMDLLLHRYFKDIDAAFPSVTATVVRTIDKLGSKFDLPEYSEIPAESIRRCEICGTRCEDDALSWIHQISVMSLGQEEKNIDEDNLDGPKNLCYGCITTFKSSRKAEVVWPKRNNSTEEVLKEFEL